MSDPSVMSNHATPAADAAAIESAIRDLRQFGLHAVAAGKNCIQGGIYPPRTALDTQHELSLGIGDPIHNVIAMCRGFRIEPADDSWRVQMTPSIGQGQHFARVDTLGAAAFLVIDMLTQGRPLDADDPRRR